MKQKGYVHSLVHRAASRTQLELELEENRTKADHPVVESRNAHM